MRENVNNKGREERKITTSYFDHKKIKFSVMFILDREVQCRWFYALTMLKKTIRIHKVFFLIQFIFYFLSD
jgi:hypothetical protein